MPQCSKCGHEISTYGLCSRCAQLVNIGKDKVVATNNVVTCPKCKSHYCKKTNDGKHVCTMCNEIF